MNECQVLLGNRTSPKISRAGTTLYADPEALENWGHLTYSNVPRSPAIGSCAAAGWQRRFFMVGSWQILELLSREDWAWRAWARLGLVVGFEADRFGGLGDGAGQVAERDDDVADVLIVAGEAFFEFFQLVGQFAVGGEQLAEADKGADHEDAHLHGPGRVEDIGGHDRAVLGEGVGQDRGKLETVEVVAICNHLGFLFGGDLEHEIFREPVAVAVAVAVDLLVQPLGGNSVKLGQVGVEHNPLAAKPQDSVFDFSDRDQRSFLLHLWMDLPRAAVTNSDREES